MATIRQKGSKLQVVIRITGAPQESRYFPSDALEEARAWAQAREAAIGTRRRTKTSLPPLPTPKTKRKLQATSGEADTPNPKGPQGDYSMTLKEALLRYELEVTPTKKSARTERTRIKKWLADSQASWELTDLDTSHFTEWRRAQEAMPTQWGQRSPSTIRSDLYLISALYRHARSEWNMPNLMNPVEGVKMPKQRRGRDVRLTEDQKAILLSVCCQSRRAKWLPYMVKLAMVTAMRQGELREQCRWETWKGRTLTLEDTKNGDRRHVPLSNAAIATITEWWEVSGKPTKGLMFPYGRVRVRDAWRKVQRFIRQNHPDFPAFTFHDLRHVAATDLAKKLHNVLELSAVTGHKSVQMLKRYYNPNPEELASRLD